MNKYKLIAFIGLLQLIYILGVILLSAIFSWWLLFLILIGDTQKIEDKILMSDNKDYNRVKDSVEFYK